MPTSSSSTPTSSSSPQAPFRSLPQKYPQAMRAASLVAQGIHGIVRKSPRSLLATVIDTSFHLTQGYVTATTQHGVVKVYAVPYGSVVPEMRIFARQVGPMSNTHDFVFDGYAPGISIRSQTSGALLYTTPAFLSTLAPLCQTATSNVTTTASLTAGPVGYYWHLFFYLPALPTSRCTLFQMSETGGTVNQLTLEYLPTGYLLFRSAEDNDGYSTTAPVAPHSIHWTVIQPGRGSGLDWLIDGVPLFTGIQSPGDAPSWNGQGATYTLSLLSNTDGTGLPPLGTWLSKFGYGTASSGGSVVPLGVDSAPSGDDTLPNSNASVTQQALLQYLFSGGSLTNSAAYAHGATGDLSLVTPYMQVSAAGPY